MLEPRRRNQRLTTESVIMSFARHGIPLDTMSRALVIPASHVRDVCNRAFNRGQIAAMPPATSANMRDALHVEIANLRDKIETLEEKLVAADIKTYEYTVWIGMCGFTHTDARVIHALVTNGRRSKDQLYFAMYGDDDQAPDPKIVDVYICKIRKKLPIGVTINTVWGLGYEMSDASRDKLRALRSGSPASPGLVPTIAEMVQ